MIKFDGWFRRRTLHVPNVTFGVNRYYFRRLKICQWSDKAVWNDSFSFHFVGLTITNIIDLSIWRLRFKQLHVPCTQRSDLYKPFPLQAKFRECEFSLWRNFAGANFRSDEISAKRKLRSLQWKRNFKKMTAKFRLTQRKFASSLTKFCRIFARTKNAKHRASFAFLLHSTVVWEFIVTKSE